MKRWMAVMALSAALCVATSAMAGGIDLRPPSGGGITATTTITNLPPAAPAGGSVTSFNYALDGGFPAIPFTISGDWGSPIPTGGIAAGFTNYGTMSNLVWQCSRATNDVAGVISIGAAGDSVTSCSGSVAWAPTNFRTRTPMVGCISTTSNDAVTGRRGGVDAVWRGDTAGAGGFVFWHRGAFISATPTTKAGIGLFDATGAAFGVNDPNTLTNTAYYGCSQANANLDICSNDGSGTATCATLGASFPCKTANAMYDFWIWAAPNASSISWFIQRLDSAASATGVITSDLPTTAIRMAWQVQIGNGNPAAGLAVTYHFNATCLAWGY